MRFAKAAGTIFLALAFSAAGMAQESAVVPTDLSQARIDEILKKVAENEGYFRSALTDYVFNRKAIVQTIGLGGQVSGTFRRDSFMTFSEDGGRFEKVLYAPIATTPPGFVTPEDLEDLGGINPFALEPKAMSQYNFRFAGTEHIDELDLYVFDVLPKEIPNPKKTKLRLFTGRIWVDKADLMIVRSKGKAVPETKENKFPIVLTTRAQIDGKYWFPVDARSDDELVFDNGNVIKIRMRVTFSDYRQGRTDVIIKEDPENPDEVPQKKPQ